MWLRIFLISIFSFISILGFSKTEDITVQVLKPATDPVSQDIQSITFVNRAMDSNFSNYDGRELQKDFYVHHFEVDKYLLDSLSADTAIAVAAHNLFVSNRFDVVVPNDRYIDRNKNWKYLPSKMALGDVREFSSLFKTDAVMSLEQYAVKVKTRYGKHLMIDEMGFREYILYATISMEYVGVWRMYDGDTGNVVKEIALNDSVYWEETGSTQKELFTKLPSIKEALSQVGIACGYDLAKKIGPEWVSQKRYYYTLKEIDNDKISTLIHDNKWKEAMELWNTMSGQKGKNYQSMLDYNLALGYEMVGEFEEAIKYAKMSNQMVERETTTAYLKRLIVRKKNFDKLDH